MGRCCASRVENNGYARGMSQHSVSVKLGKQPEIREMIEREIEERLHGGRSGGNNSMSTSVPSNGSTADDATASSTATFSNSSLAESTEETATGRETAATETSTTNSKEVFNFWKTQRRNAERNTGDRKPHLRKKHSKFKSDSTHHILSPVPNATNRVLLFYAVGAEDRVINLVMQNVAHAREQLPSVDVYLAHYDLKQALWIKRNADWYHKNVDFSAEATGFKFQLMKRLLSGGPFSPDLNQYAWVWALDEDVDFTKTNLTRLFELADTSGALLGLPTFTELDSFGKDKNLNYPMQMPQTGCSFRYTPVVEVIFPFIRPAVLSALFHDCNHCIHEKSVWGLDRMWCSWSAELFQWNPSHACALIDETPVVHRNFKTLRGKYIVSGAREMQFGFMDMAMADFKDVLKHHKSNFVEGPASQMRSSACVLQQQRFHRSHRRFRVD